jgi:excisionase family DNA binding protein
MATQKRTSTKSKLQIQKVQLLSPGQLAQRWGVSYPTIMREIRCGTLRAMRVGKKLKVTMAVIERREQG